MRRITLDCLIDEQTRKVMIQVLDSGMKDQAIWTTTFLEQPIPDDDDGPQGWSPEGDSPVEQLKGVMGVLTKAQRSSMDQLSMLLHIGMHNMLRPAREALGLDP